MPSTRRSTICTPAPCSNPATRRMCECSASRIELSAQRPLMRISSNSKTGRSEKAPAIPLGPARQTITASATSSIAGKSCLPARLFIETPSACLCTSAACQSSFDTRRVSSNTWFWIRRNGFLSLSTDRCAVEAQKCSSMFWDLKVVTITASQIASQREAAVRWFNDPTHPVQIIFQTFPVSVKRCSSHLLRSRIYIRNAFSFSFLDDYLTGLNCSLVFVIIKHELRMSISFLIFV